MHRLRICFAMLAVASAVLSVQPAAAFTTDATAGRSVADATRRLDQATARLAQLNDQVERGQGKLDAASRQLEADAASVAKLNTELGGIARFQYEQPNLIFRLASARSFSEVMADVSQSRIISSRRQALLERQREIRRRDQEVRDRADQDLKAVRISQAEAATVAAQAEAELASAQAEEVRVRAAQIAAQASLTSTRVQAPAAFTPVAASVPRYSGGAVGNHFTYGYCTWYVANRRSVPWFGNAAEWWGNARAYGFAEGGAPRPGAIMVTGESGYGHVAYVESVNGDGSWTVSEMNYAGWGVQTSRTIRPGQVPLYGFIY